MVFTSLAFVFLEKSAIKKAGFLLLFLLFLFTIFITGSRAAYIGIILGLAFYFFFYPKKLAGDNEILFNWINPKRLKIFRMLSLALIILAILFLAYVNTVKKLPDFIEDNKRLSYFFHNRLSFEVVSRDLLETRLAVWQITLRAIKEKPLLGWGPENFDIGFEKYYDPTLPNMQRLWWDRPHNVLLEVFVNSGIFAFVFYITFWIAILWQLQIFKKKNEDKKNMLQAHSLQAMFIGYLAVLFFNFDSFSTYLISFFFIGYALHLLSLNADSREILPRQKNLPFQNYIAGALLIMALLFLWFWNIKPLYFNEKMVLAQNLSKARRCSESIETLKSSKWENAGIIKPYTALRYADIVKDCGSAQPLKEVELGKKTVLLLKEASQIQPRYSRTWLFLGSFTNALAARQEKIEDRNQFLEEAKSYFAKGLQLSPKRQEILIELEKSYLVEGDYDSMKKKAQDCIAIDPRRGICYWYLGIAEIFLGDQENGKKHIEESLQKGGFSPPYIQLGAAYISNKNYKDAAYVYHLLTAAYPENDNHHAVMAMLSKEIGDYQRSMTEMLKLFKLHPKNPEIPEFAKELARLKPLNPYLLDSLVFIYQSRGEEDKATEELLRAENLYLRAILNNPNLADNHLKIANIYRQLQDYDKSMKEAILALKLNPGLRESVAYFLQNLPANYRGGY